MPVYIGYNSGDRCLSAMREKYIQATLSTILRGHSDRERNAIGYWHLEVSEGHRIKNSHCLENFDREDSIFRSLCNEAGLSRQDIVRIRASAQIPNNDAENTV